MTAVVVEGLHAGILRDVSLEVRAGELLTLVGPSGCGKSTFLRVLAGLLDPTAGSVRIGDRLVAGAGVRPVPPERRRVGLVFQEHALFPHLTVAENVGFGLPRRERRAEVPALLELIRLGALAGRYPHELSGGEQQRVALARALAPRPDVVLLDEPFAALDPGLRAELREQVVGVLRARAATAVLVTHDRDEALAVGDRVAVLHGGRLEQLGEPEEVHDRPATAFVARFVAGADLVPLWPDADHWTSEVGPVRLETPPPPARDVALVVHHHDLALEPGGPARVIARTYGRGVHHYRLRLPSGTVVHAEDRRRWDEGTALSVRLRKGAGTAWVSVGS